MSNEGLISSFPEPPEICSEVENVSFWLLAAARTESHDNKVISRTSVMGYKDTVKRIPQIAQELGAANILEGGIQRSGH